MGEKRNIAVTINGKKYQEEVEVRYTLADFMRQQLGLTGTHLGCEHGVCGACTILFDGLSARSCLMLAVQADGHEILTVEGIAPSADKMHPLQEAFRDNHGLQCGYCTPGMIMSAIDIVTRYGGKLDALEDVHASATYRQHLAAVLSRRALEQARDRIPPRTVGAKVA